MSGYGVFLFKKSSVAVEVEKRLTAAGFSVAMIPVPREISDDCGVSVRFDPDCLDQIESVLKQLGFEHDGVHFLD